MNFLAAAAGFRSSAKGFATKAPLLNNHQKPNPEIKIHYSIQEKNQQKNQQQKEKEKARNKIKKHKPWWVCYPSSFATGHDCQLRSLNSQFGGNFGHMLRTAETETKLYTIEGTIIRTNILEELFWGRPQE